MAALGEVTLFNTELRFGGVNLLVPVAAWMEKEGFGVDEALVGTFCQGLIVTW